MENIKSAIWNASRKKKKRHQVKMILENIDYYAKELQEMLVSKTYVPSPYIEEILKDGNSKKERLIYKPKFYPDQCIHWALMHVIEGPLSKGMYQYTCGSIPKRGTHYARKYVKRCINRDPKHTKYVLQIDISKFYPSIKHTCLKDMLRNKFKDPDVLWLLDQIIDSTDTGLPIGNYTSQWLANFYLQNFDHYIKQRLGVKHYVRYMDDCVFMGNNKKKLHIVRIAIKSFLASIGLKLKHNWQVYRLDCRPLDFVGFRFFRTHILMRKRNALRIKRRVSKMHKKDYYAYRDCAALVSYFGWLKYSNSYNFYKKNIEPYVDITKMKEVISNESKKQRLAQVF